MQEEQSSRKAKARNFVGAPLHLPVGRHQKHTLFVNNRDNWDVENRDILARSDNFQKVVMDDDESHPVDVNVLLFACRCPGKCHEIEESSLWWPLLPEPEWCVVSFLSLVVYKHIFPR